MTPCLSRKKWTFELFGVEALLHPKLFGRMCALIVFVLIAPFLGDDLQEARTFP
jgi:hypothetical protein